MTHPVLRVARPTDDLDELLPFYRDGLGLEVLASFRDHDGFDGVILGRPGAPWHLEFTRAPNSAVSRVPAPDNLLVLYESGGPAWEVAVARMRAAGFEPVPSFNPWWDARGATFEDPEGWRVVLCRDGWAL
jgi:catechol 2,3-dioxygenase-like lactoylglutathione lyase family enzyme